MDINIHKKSCWEKRQSGIEETLSEWGWKIIFKNQDQNFYFKITSQLFLYVPKFGISNHQLLKNTQWSMATAWFSTDELLPKSSKKYKVSTSINSYFDHKSISQSLLQLLHWKIWPWCHLHNIQYVIRMFKY